MSWQKNFTWTRYASPWWAPTEVLHVLDEPIAKTNELAQVLGHGVRQSAHLGTLLRREPSDAQRVDGVRLCPLHLLCGEPVGAQGVDQRHAIALHRESGEEVLPAKRFFQ
jgi:hypothetical protein